MLLLTACGGSGDDGAGQLTTYQVLPTEATLTSGSLNCPGYDTTPAAPVKAAEFLVVGGTAPYTVTTAFPTMVFFGAHGATAPTHQGSFVVSNRNTQFSVFVMGCLTPGVITVLDDLQRIASVSVTAASGSGN